MQKTIDRCCLQVRAGRYQPALMHCLDQHRYGGSRHAFAQGNQIGRCLIVNGTAFFLIVAIGWLQRFQLATAVFVTFNLV
jgi:hypothetical protein